MLKEQKGITLVALIITIIVMLILAGVSISLVVGENGVLTQAQDVEPAQIKGSLKEAVSMANADMIATYYGNSADGFTGVTNPTVKGNIGTFINNNFSYAKDTNGDNVIAEDKAEGAKVTVDGTTVTIEYGTESVTATLDTSKTYIQLKNVQ